MASLDHAYEERGHRRTPDQAAAPVPDELTSSQRLASTVGNQAFARIAREGAGILPDGRAHPDVEDAIARTRGGGGKLDERSQQQLSTGLGDPLDDVRVHTDETANTLATAVSARAFTTGSDVYFARGEYSPGSSDGQRLLAHEVSHVVQQRGAPTSGPLVVSNPGDALEVEAEQTAGDLVG